MPIIKRYANRKLYNLDSRRYVTLDDVARMIRDGEDVRVLDHASGEDITPVVQAQIIFNEERRIRGGLPTAVLTNLIQSGSDKLQRLQSVFTPEPGTERVDAEIERRVRLLIQRGDLKKAQGERLLAKLLALGNSDGAQRPAEPDLEQVLDRYGLASRSDVEALERQIDLLARELKRLSARKPTRSR